MILNDREFVYARDFGRISPASNKTRKLAKAVSAAAVTPKFRPAFTVSTLAAEKKSTFTIMFPNSRQLKSDAGLAMSFAARFCNLAWDFFRSATCLLERLKKAVSAPEKKAEPTSKKSIKSNSHRLDKETCAAAIWAMSENKSAAIGMALLIYW